MAEVKPRGRNGPRRKKSDNTESVSDQTVMQAIVRLADGPRTPSSSRRRKQRHGYGDLDSPFSPHYRRRCRYDESPSPDTSPRRRNGRPYAPYTSQSRTLWTQHEHSGHGLFATHTSNRPLSPLPAKGSELKTFLADLHETVGVDLTTYEGQLAALDFTPNVIPSVLDARLAEVVPILAEGTIIKLKDYAQMWSARLNDKRVGADKY
jgi:hypothetical protein